MENVNKVENGMLCENMKRCLVLYKYMDVSGFEKTIEKWSLKGCLSHEANDPMEFMLQAKSPGDDVFDDTGSPRNSPPPFLCFSTKITNSAMWGHYADSGRGVCLVFLFPILSDSYEMSKKTQYSVPLKVDCSYIDHSETEKRNVEKSHIQKVAYKLERRDNEENLDKRINDYLDAQNREYGLYADEESRRHEFYRIKSGWFDSFLTTKAISWSYESEVRLLSPCCYVDNVHGPLMLFEWPMCYLIGAVAGPKCQLSSEQIALKLSLAYSKSNTVDGRQPQNIAIRHLEKIIAPARDLFFGGQKVCDFFVFRANYHWRDAEIEVPPLYDDMDGAMLMQYFSEYPRYMGQWRDRKDNPLFVRTWNELHNKRALFMVNFPNSDQLEPNKFEYSLDSPVMAQLSFSGCVL